MCLWRKIQRLRNEEGARAADGQKETLCPGRSKFKHPQKLTVSNNSSSAVL